MQFKTIPLVRHTNDNGSATLKTIMMENASHVLDSLLLTPLGIVI